ncbi:MAG: FtsX-like permease family protein, partial [Flavobacteriaceae bacterium]|nr:FtsX-like permease family protein [Flavobacteriaceae bacterium]
FFDYFETLGLKMIHGRSFNRNFPYDLVDKGRGAFILNQKAVEVMGIEDPIDKEFQAYNVKGPIVGIVQNFNFKSLHSEITPMCFNMNPFYLNEIVVRINPTNKTVLADIVKVWKKFVPNYPIEFNYISDDLEKLYGAEQNLAVTLSIFTIVAMVIACMGLLALTSLAVQNRTKEIGIRKVNGAKTFEILTMLNKDFLKLVLIAFVIASPIAYYAMNKWLENFAYKTEMSWWIFALAGIMALLIALITVSFQTYRAATKNPVLALRDE